MASLGMRGLKGFSLAVAACVLLPAAAVCSLDSDRDTYTSRLTALLKAGDLDPGEAQVARVNESRQQFLQFKDEYPRSVYADDSLFVYTMIEFMGALMVPPRDLAAAKQMIVMMDDAVRRYPGGCLEPLTYRILEQELGADAVGGAFYMPYRCVVEYMQALLYSQTKDYKNAIMRYTRLKERLQPIVDANIAIEIYAPLYIAYKRTDRSRDAQAVLDEVAGLYPGSELESTIRSIDISQ